MTLVSPRIQRPHNWRRRAGVVQPCPPENDRTGDVHHRRVTYNIQVAALDTTDDGEMNYDTLVFFNAAEGIRPGPFQLPSTGPAYVHASSGKSSLLS